MEHLKPFHEKITHRFLTQSEIAIGMVGIDDDDVKSTIVKIYTPEELKKEDVWNDLKYEWDEDGTYTSYDSYKMSLEKFYDLVPKAYWVAVEGNFENKFMRVRGEPYKYNRKVFQYGSTSDGKYIYWVPESEGWKKYAKDNLKDANAKMGILENVKPNDNLEYFDKHFLHAKDVKPGMVGTSYNGQRLEILKMIQVETMMADMPFWRKFMEDNSSWPENNITSLINGKFIHPRQFVAYVKNSNGDRTVVCYYHSSFGVPKDEAWKNMASDELINVANKTGIMEKIIINEGKSWFTDEENLSPEDVVPGMVGYDIYNGKAVVILETHRIGDLSPAEFEKLQRKSSSLWLSYEYQTIKPSHQPEQYVPVKNMPILSVDDFLKKNSFVENLTLDNYLMVVKTDLDINGNNISDYSALRNVERDATEVLP